MRSVPLAACVHRWSLVTSGELPSKAPIWSLHRAETLHHKSRYYAAQQGLKACALWGISGHMQRKKPFRRLSNYRNAVLAAGRDHVRYLNAMDDTQLAMNAPRYVF